MTAYTSYLFGSVMKMGIVPENVDIIEKALNFCAQNQNDDGSFQETSQSLVFTFPEELQESQSACLTLFVIISFLKNQEFVQNSYTHVIKKAFDYIYHYLLQLNSEYDIYPFAVFAYAEALANRSDHQICVNIIKSLYMNFVTDGETKYFKFGKDDTVASLDKKVFISAYVAMAYIQIDQIKDAKPIIRWLLQQVTSQGISSSSYSTAVAMEALAMMSEKIGVGNTSIQFKIFNDDKSEIKEYTLNNKNQLTPHIIPMPHGINGLFIEARGIGYGDLEIFFEYDEFLPYYNKIFNIDVRSTIKTDDLVKIDACATRDIDEQDFDYWFKPNTDRYDVVIMEFRLTNGFVYVAEQSKPMNQYEDITVSSNIYLLL